MKKLMRSRNFIKAAFVAIAVFIGLIGAGLFSDGSFRANASASGPSPTYTNAPGEGNCTACHTSFPVNSGTGSVTVTGIPANYKPNQQIPVTVTTSQEDGVIYGFEMTAIDYLGRGVGTFTPQEGMSQPVQTVNGIVGGNMRQYIEHTIDGVLPTQFGSKSWKFTWTAPSSRVGKVSFYAAGNAANSDGSTSGDYIYTTTQGSLSGTAIGNFDGDLASDIAVWRPSDGNWYSYSPITDQTQIIHFGQAGDKIVPGDYDGDGKTDLAVFRPSNGIWFIQQSTAGFKAVQWGLSDDLPIPGDYDGDLKTDIAVWRPSAGLWYIIGSSASIPVVQWGISTDKPVIGDFDADGKTDIAVWRPSTGIWYLQKSSEGFAAFQYGAPDDKPLPADYDGDGRTDLAVFRPSNGIWFWQTSSALISPRQFGQQGDIAVPADYDGDGKSDLAVYRPSNGVWFIVRSTDGSLIVKQWGASSDKIVPAAYVPEQVP